MRTQHRSAPSLRLRLLAGTLLWTAITLAGTGWFLSSLFQQHVTEQLYQTLEYQLEQLTGATTATPEGKIAVSRQLNDPRLQRPYSGLYWQIDQVSNNSGPAIPALLRSRSLWDSILSVPDDIPANGELHRHQTTGPNGNTLFLLERLVYPAEAPNRGLRLMFAADSDLVTAPVKNFNDILTLALLTLGFGLLAAAVMQVLIGLRPLSQLRSSLQAVNEGKAQRIKGNYPQEVQPLVDDFNSVLGQNTRVVEQARTHAGNLAHALKTPLAILSNAAARPDHNLPALVNEQVATARRQIDHHLARARAAAAVNVPGMRTEVRPTLEALIGVMLRLNQDKNIKATIITDARLSPVFRGEKQDLQEMLGNLLENAWKWGKSTINITIEPGNGYFKIIIDDDGPGLPEEQRNLVLSRGTRADESVPGSGLGLAIVSDLANLYHGALTLEHSPLGGLRASLTLPHIGLQT
ncbi:sensor histidine kinase [Marinobacter sp.]|uniref:sensor histidine kinase n=1 Tax=Marinobacter sp. TaxID=50741 RepID=UPI0035662DC0